MNRDSVVKEKLFDHLDATLNALQGYDIASLMPLLYVLVAHKEGHFLSIVGNNSTNIFDTANRRIQPIWNVDGNESDLLKEIYKSVNPDHFVGRSAEIVFHFYDLWNTCIIDYYQEIIEHIISYYSQRGARYDGMAITPKELAQLMASIIQGMNPKGIYDPCAGLCSCFIQHDFKECSFIGQEINTITKVIADVRIDAFKRKATIFNEDSMQYWRGDDGSDCLVSELPFGLILNPNERDPQMPRLLEDAVLYNFTKSPTLKTAVLLVPMGICDKRSNQSFRKTLFENNWIECVVKLPAGILPHTGVTTAIVVLNKHRISEDIRFVLAEDCIFNKGKRRLLDHKSVLDRLSNLDDKQTATININDITINEHGYSLNPSVYIQKKIDVIPGQKLVKFTELATLIRGGRNYEETKGRVLQKEHLCNNIIETHTRNIVINEVGLLPAHMKICEKCIIFNLTADKFYIKNDNDPLFVSKLYTCFVVNEDKCLPEYLADCIISAREFKESVFMGAVIQRIDWNNLILPVFEDLESQNQIVLRKYREEQNELKRKLESLQVLSGKSSDLIHSLGITFTKISAGIGKLKEQLHDEAVDGLSDNVQFALRQINSTGTDFAFVQPEKEKVNLLDTLKRYIKAWGNFGYRTFNILPIKNGMSEDTKVVLDTNLFFTMLDCIFINAHQHGFNKRENPENKLLIEIAGVIYQEEKYVRLGISNNGKPFPANFSLQDFVTRGVVGINSSQDGIGGDHICKIAHHFGGFVSIDNDTEWLTFNILLPVYLTSNETKFDDYECKCV